MSSRPLLLVFDWDGTVVDSVRSIADCLHAAVADLGLPPIDDQRVRRTVGMGMPEILAALGLDGEEVPVARLRERYRHHWFATYGDRPLPFPGAAAALERLAGDGFLLAVATGKGRRGLDRDLGRTGLGGVFHATRTADEAFAKPHPQMLLDLLDELGTRPGEALMIGDTTFDLEMAANAGTAAVAVASGTHRRADLERWRPRACLESVAELPGWLDGDGITGTAEARIAEGRDA